MAPITPDQDTPGGQDPARDPDVLDTGQFAARTGFREHTVTDWCNAGYVRGATKLGTQWRIHYPTFWAELCGRPGVPYGEILSAAQLAARIGLHEKTVRRMLASGEIPGLQLGGKNGPWLCAQPAVWMRFGWSLPDAAPEPPATVSRPLAAPVLDGAGQPLDLAAADAPGPPALRGPGAARAGAPRVGRRRPRPGPSPGRSAPAR
jgi:excisionase family DNA binding protein